MTNSKPIASSDQGQGESGTHHWIIQRQTGVVLAPLLLFFLYKLKGFYAQGYEGCLKGFASPWMGAYTLTLIAIVFYHAYLGLQVVIEDYVHCFKMKALLLTLTKFICFAAVILTGMLLVHISFTHFKV